MNHSNNCLLLFVKSPIKGQVKTRLAAQTGGDFEVELYKCFVVDIISLVENLGVQFKVCFCPANKRLNFSEWLGEQHCYKPQTGNNLGEKLRNAFDNTFEEGFSNVVAIGSDSPDLPANYLTESFEVLAEHDSVIGPANDGGYYLIGFSKERFIPEVFDNISWSTDCVFEQTVSILKQHGRKVYLLPLWHDVDTIADLKSLLLRTKNTAFEKSKTYSYLTANGSWSQPDVRL
ncbi:MAG: TIGR04282 family arsenosugar biosynthesis glycosyltransferase [Planctomycetota bacterium]|jgi:rSAM/selenodomain-associated transferase 1